MEGLTHLEAPVLARHIVAYQLDLAYVAHAQAALVGQADVVNGQGVEAHQFGGHGVNGHLVGRGQDDILDLRLHGARAGAVASGGAVHHGEDARVDLLLNRQQVYQRFVDPGVGVVAVGAEEPSEGVLHRSGGYCVDVALNRRQMNNVLAEEVVGDADASGIDAIQHQHLGFGLVGHPGHIPVLEVVENRDVVVAEDGHVMVQVLTFEGVDHHRLVLHTTQVGEASLVQGQHRALQLPGRGVGAGHRVVPGDVVFENGGRFRVEGLAYLGQFQQPFVVF